jgi:hypothetical protein
LASVLGLAQRRFKGARSIVKEAALFDEVAFLKLHP